MALHKPQFEEKLFFVFSGAVISTPFPALANSLVSYSLMLDLPRYQAVLISVAVAAPVLEEFAKAYPLFYRHGETERSIVVLGFLTGLGFGIAEYFLYVYIFNAPPTIRLPLALFHATNTAIVAYGIAKKSTLPFYLIAVALHALNNYSAQVGFWLSGGVVAAIISYAVAWNLYKKSTDREIKY